MIYRYNMKGNENMKKEKLRPTLNETEQNVKEEVIPVLNHLLAEFLTLALVTKQAHWNMRGNNFISVHEMLDPFNAQLLVYADQVAERVVQLGGTALGTPQVIVEDSCCPAYPLDISSVEDHLKELHVRYAQLANHLRDTIKKELGDETTLNILTDASQTIDKYMWFIEAQLNYEG